MFSYIKNNLVYLEDLIRQEFFTDQFTTDIIKIKTKNFIGNFKIEFEAVPPIEHNLNKTNLSVKNLPEFKKQLESLLKLVYKMDYSGDGFISIEEVQNALEVNGFENIIKTVWDQIANAQSKWDWRGNKIIPDLRFRSIEYSINALKKQMFDNKERSYSQKLFEQYPGLVIYDDKNYDVKFGYEGALNWAYEYGQQVLMALEQV